jgi:antitoxin (DNA-binding transcriptional repressor) of toxin-antitoxin stability system
MLTGTAAAEVLAESLPAPTIDAWPTEPFVLEQVTVLQVIAELRRPGRDALLPPALHPTDPPALSLQAWRVGDSTVGPFAFAHTRLSCRSGVRARGLTTAAFGTSPDAAALLRDRLGFPCRPAEVDLEAHYDGCDLTVTVDGRPVLVVVAHDPQPLGADDVQYTSTLNLAHTPNGLRLVQVETDHDADSVERVGARIVRFEADTWGDARLDPYHVVTTTLARDRRITLPPVRFVCRPDVSAFEGTESIRAR